MAALAAALLSCPEVARAQAPGSPDFQAQRDHFMRQRNGVVGTLGAWSALSLVGGTLITLDPAWLPRVAPTRIERRAFGVATLSFAVVNSVFAIVGAANSSALRRSLGDPAALAHERHAGGSFFAVNAGLDMLYISAGALLFRNTSPMWRGFGAGVMSQGGFLLGFDVSAALLYRHGGR